MKNILLVSPLFEDRHKLFEDEGGRQQKGSDRGFMAPVSIATVAALTPPEIRVELYDENVRVTAISGIFRRRGILVGIGGPAASTTPERYVELADIVFVGEAEYIWPAFLQEWESGKHRKIYRQVIKPELEASRPPRWELLGNDIHRYLMGAVQTSRGCPFDCEFCDVPYIFGHRSRWKPVADVLR
jgi:radical SAM superfamily enzyme YgiQ (UPF0313 family)